jgi:hypothetical protein
VTSCKDDGTEKYGREKDRNAYIRLGGVRCLWSAGSGCTPSKTPTKGDEQTSYKREKKRNEKLVYDPVGSRCEETRPANAVVRGEMWKERRRAERKMKQNMRAFGLKKW